MSETMNFIDQATTFVSSHESQSKTQWLADFRLQQQTRFSQNQWPTRKTENWKYTSLNALQQANFNQPSQASSTIDESAYAIENLNAQTLVFVDGVFDATRSQLDIDSNASVCLFSEANEKQQALIQNYLGKASGNSSNIFTHLNGSLTHDGLLIHVAKGQTASPIHVVHYASSQTQAATAQSRHLFVVEDNAQAAVIEHFASVESNGNSLFNQLTEIELGNNAHLHHYRLHLEDEQMIHLGAMHANLQRDAQLNSFHLALGGKIKRIDIEVNYQGSGAHSDVNGVYLTKNRQHVDYHTNMEHAVPHCTTSEVFRGIMDDNSKAVFNGRIHIHPQAQKTLAELSNKNLLLSNKAEINTKPELEIYADDVRCAHGATVSQMDNNALFYLLSRGISREEAERMLSFGFINELIDGVKHEAIGAYLRPVIAELFGNQQHLAECDL
ncbi:Fe-S cluster assembly protein SufD [Pleionea sp. CnH1-48]|uniref:Fe-S cluster assembly protein SufD n=1 Tax=Pleionea sp. CnH1-48 TaxID=2954494 RepID=UPI002097F486|nr:Fe-S cluster assembly protein SufD [Pleionea sp. CnH1-48]MCO7226870.1 Fe-S cluster assembly protein SufD [Pleionea sp. CnH1-48]